MAMAKRAFEMQANGFDSFIIVRNRERGQQWISCSEIFWEEFKVSSATAFKFVLSTHGMIRLFGFKALRLIIVAKIISLIRLEKQNHDMG